MHNKSPNNQNLLPRLWGDARGFHRHLLLLLLLQVLAAPVTLAMPLPIKIGIDCVLADKPLPPLLHVFVPESLARSTSGTLIVVVALIMGIALVAQLRSLAAATLHHYVGESLVLRFRARLFNHANHLSFAVHDARGTADALYRIQHDGMATEGVLVNGLTPLVTAFVSAVAMGVTTALLDWQLAIVALGAALPLVVVTRAFQPLLRQRWGVAKEWESSVLDVVQEVLTSLRVVRAYSQEEREVQRFTHQAQLGLRARLRAVSAECWFGVLVGVIFAGGTAAVLALGLLHAQAGKITLGDLTLIMFYLVMLYQPLESMGKTAAALQSSLASAERAYALLDLPCDVERRGGQALERAQGQIEFCDVSFQYDERRTVLHDISLVVPAGSCVGVIGTTGAGKSTFVSLLLRFYDPTTGNVLLDGVDLREYSLNDLRRQISIVLQDTVLFSTSIAENIAYGCPDASRELIITAAQQANAHEFISRLPEGYETPVGERGMQLSGGERQRIALARAFLRDAPILVLDEPTSAVDTRTEALVLEAIARLLQDRTTFLISHRPQTLDVCDFVIRLEDGRIVACDRPTAVS